MMSASVRVEVNHQKQSLIISYEGEQVRQLHKELETGVLPAFPTI